MNPDNLISVTLDRLARELRNSRGSRRGWGGRGKMKSNRKSRKLNRKFPLK